MNVELVTCNPVDSGRWVYTATALRQAQDNAAGGPSTSSGQATGTTVRIAVTALRQPFDMAQDKAQDAATDRPGGVAEAEEEKAV